MKSRVCMSHNKNLAPTTGTQLLLEMYKIGPTKVLCPWDKDKGVGAGGFSLNCRGNFFNGVSGPSDRGPAPCLLVSQYLSFLS